MIDGEYNFFVQKLVDLYIKNGIDECVTHVYINYQFVGEPSPQKRVLDQANGEFYAYASATYPARKGLKCQYEDCECDGSDVVGCTYCRCQPPEPHMDWFN